MILFNNFKDISFNYSILLFTKRTETKFLRKNVKTNLRPRVSRVFE